MRAIPHAPVILSAEEVALVKAALPKFEEQAARCDTLLDGKLKNGYIGGISFGA
jgi:hypothetical protein